MTLDAAYKIFVSQASKKKRKLEEREESVKVKEDDVESKQALLTKSQDEHKLDVAQVEKTRAILQRKQKKLEDREEALKKRLQEAQRLFN